MVVKRSRSEQRRKRNRNYILLGLPALYTDTGVTVYPALRSNRITPFCPPRCPAPTAKKVGSLAILSDITGIQLLFRLLSNRSSYPATPDSSSSDIIEIMPSIFCSL